MGLYLKLTVDGQFDFDLLILKPQFGVQFAHVDGGVVGRHRGEQETVVVSKSTLRVTVVPAHFPALYGLHDNTNNLVVVVLAVVRKTQNLSLISRPSRLMSRSTNERRTFLTLYQTTESKLAMSGCGHLSSTSSLQFASLSSRL